MSANATLTGAIPQVTERFAGQTKHIDSIEIESWVGYFMVGNEPAENTHRITIRFSTQSAASETGWLQFETQKILTVHPDDISHERAIQWILYVANKAWLGENTVKLI